METWFEGSVPANGLTIHYHRTGGADKPQLILLHGVMDNGLCWTSVASDLQDRFDVLMPDARGHGRTGGSLENLSYEMLAEDVVAFIHALDLQKPALFGHSMGGLTAAVAAASYPDLVRAIVMEDPPFVDAPPTGSEGAEQARGISQMMQALANVRLLSPEQRLAAARTFNPLWNEGDLEPWVESKVEFDLGIFRYLEVPFPWREVLPRITCPVLLITGDPDRQALITPRIAQEAAHLWHDGEVVHIQDAGHSIHRDRYAETMQPLRAFLNQI